MKKFLSLLLVVALTATAAVGGTLAYLTDRDSEVNVYTVGNVNITLNEAFEQGAQLLPGVKLEKVPTITNTGDNDAWVWMTVAIPSAIEKITGSGEGGATNILHWNCLGATWEGNVTEERVSKAIAAGYLPAGTTAGDILADQATWDVTTDVAAYTTDINGTDYNVYTLLYNKALTPGETTLPSFYQAYLDTKVDYDHDTQTYYLVDKGVKTKIDFDLSKTLIYVNAYAIQADTFTTVNDAHDAYKNQWVDAEGVDQSVDYAKVATVATADELAEALAGSDIVYLTEDVTVASTMKIAKDSDVEINLNGNDLSYGVSNDGKAAALISNAGTLTISGEGTIGFVAADPDMTAIPAYATNTITNTGTLIIGEGVIVTNGSDGGASYAVDNQGGKLILNGGTLKGNRCALRVARFNKDSEFIMNSGTVTAATPAWIHLPGSNAADAPSIAVTINGGTFKSTKPTSDENDVLYTYSFGNSHANTSITINGGFFLGGTLSIGSGYKGDAPTLKINGGSFEYDVLQWLAGDNYNVLYEANVATASAEDALTDALASGSDVILTDDIALTGQLTTNGSTLNGGGQTINVTDDYTGSNYDCAVNTPNGGTVENLTVTGDPASTRALGTGSSGTDTLSEDLYINNVYVDKVMYAINGSGASTANVYVTDSTLYGWLSYSGINSFNFTNCTIGKGNSSYGYMAVYGTTNFTDCAFEGIFDMGARAEAAGKTITFTNCTYDGEKVTAENFVEYFYDPGDDADFGLLMSECTIMVDGVQVDNSAYVA